MIVVNYLRSFKSIRYLYQRIRSIVRFNLYVVRLVTLYVLRGVSALVPKRNNLWLFGSRAGMDFADNAKYLYLYVQKNCDGIDGIWISKNKKIIKKLRDQQFPAYYTYSLKGIAHCLRSRVIFTTHGKDDINPALTGGSIHVELYHFVMAPKKLRYDVFNNYTGIQKISFELSHPFIYKKPDYGISSSAFVSKIVRSSLCLSKERVFITGAPRTDAMLNDTKEDMENVQKVLGGQKYNHLIYYVPTFREGGEDFDYLAFGLDQSNLVNFLEKTNSVLIIRLHPFDSFFKKKTIDTFHKRIIFENSLSDPFSLLKKASILITDYSSVFVDFLLMDRPIIFANFDHQNYLSKRELYWEYNDFTPGPKTEDWQLLLSHLKNIIIHQKDEYTKARQKLKNIVYQFNDPNSCARVVKKIYRILEL